MNAGMNDASPVVSFKHTLKCSGLEMYVEVHTLSLTDQVGISLISLINTTGGSGNLKGE